MKKPDLESLKKELETIVESLGFELVELSAPVIGGRLTLRLFVHSSHGVTLDDCAVISEAISDKLDSESPIEGRYTLEVSSLGLDRQLITAIDYQRRIGEKVEINFNDNGKKASVTGLLKKVDDKVIEIEKDDEIVKIPVDADPRGKIVI